MLTHPFNPRAEKDALYDAIGLFRERWKQKPTADAVFDLCEAIERADDVCTELKQCQLDPQSDHPAGVGRGRFPRQWNAL